MAEALDSNPHGPTRIRQVPIENAGDGGLFASLEPQPVRANLAAWSNTCVEVLSLRHKMADSLVTQVQRPDEGKWITSTRECQLTLS